MSAIASSSNHAKQVRYKCSHCKERGHKRKFCPTRSASATPPCKNKPPLRTQPRSQQRSQPRSHPRSQPRSQPRSHQYGVIGDGRKWRRLVDTTPPSETQEAAAVLTIADVEFEKMCVENGQRRDNQPPIKKSDRRVSFAAEPTVIKVAKLHENREDREQLWWSAANQQRARIEKRSDTFWARTSDYRWVIDEDVWNIYAKLLLKSTSTLPPPYNKSSQPDRGLY